MAMGKKCPNCKEQTYHDKGSHYECSECNYVGWPANMPVENVGGGRGNTCPNCSNLTLHDISEVSNVIVRRCSVCGYTGIHSDR